ncbi:MAG: DUF4410 domain-containing protein [Candidatus Omnitrophota bacterium]
MKRISVFFVLAFFIFAVSGCGSSHIRIINPTRGNVGRVNSIQVNEVKSDVPVTKEVCDEIRKILIKNLKLSKAFDSVSEYDGAIAIDSKITRFNAGNQFSRWMWGGLDKSAEGILMLETIFTDKKAGEEIAKIATEGTISDGLFGGSVESAYSNAIQEIVKFAEDNFGKK